MDGDTLSLGSGFMSDEQTAIILTGDELYRLRDDASKLSFDTESITTTTTEASCTSVGSQKSEIQKVSGVCLLYPCGRPSAAYHWLSLLATQLLNRHERMHTN